MAHVCPVWVGRLLASPIRRLVENPEKMMRPFVREGMVVLEPGCGMGFFSIPIARLVGKNGSVVVVDVQQAMLDGVRKRAEKAGVSGIIDCRLADGNEPCLEDLKQNVDFIPVIHMLHETPDQHEFLCTMHNALKPGGILLVIEPGGHVSGKDFAEVRRTAKEIGFREIDESGKLRAVFQKPESVRH